MEPMKNYPLNISHEALYHAIELSGQDAAFFALYQAEIVVSIIHKQGLKTPHILDYGCGDGTMAYLFSQLLPDARIQGVDGDAESIEIAKEWYQKLPSLRYDILRDPQQIAQGFIENENISKQYDVIYLANVLHHIGKNMQQGQLNTLRSHLAPGGLLIILEFNPWNPLQVWRFYTDTEERGNHMILPRTLEKLLRNFGKVEMHYYKKIYALILSKT